MQEYSMLFLDIDGTVLDTQNRISPNLKQRFKLFPIAERLDGNTP